MYPQLVLLIAPLANKRGTETSRDPLHPEEMGLVVGDT